MCSEQRWFGTTSKAVQPGPGASTLPAAGTGGGARRTPMQQRADVHAAACPCSSVPMQQRAHPVVLPLLLLLLLLLQGRAGARKRGAGRLCGVRPCAARSASHSREHCARAFSTGRCAPGIPCRWTAELLLLSHSSMLPPPQTSSSPTTRRPLARPRPCRPLLPLHSSSVPPKQASRAAPKQKPGQLPTMRRRRTRTRGPATLPRRVPPQASPPSKQAGHLPTTGRRHTLTHPRPCRPPLPRPSPAAATPPVTGCT